MLDRVTQGGISTMRLGAGNMQGLTLPHDRAEDHTPPAAEDDPAMFGGSPQIVLIGFAGILVLLWFVRKQSSHLQSEAFGINLFNLLTITITAIVGIVLFKVLFNRVPVPGVTSLVNAV